MDTESQNNIQQLNEVEFEKLFKQYFKPLCYLAKRYVKDIDMAKEIVQESFISLWMKRDNIDVSKSVKLYLNVSVQNKCLNYLRDSKKFDKDILINEQLFNGTDGETTDVMVVKDISSKIDNAIAELPEKCRDIFIMNRYQNMKYHEIAKKREISVKTVETQMSKALKHLRFRLAEYLNVLIAILYFLKNYYVE